jgi:hypothetical protein
MSEVDKKIEIQGHGIKIGPELKSYIQRVGYYPVALTWLGDDITGPFSFTGYGDNSPFELHREDGAFNVYHDGEYFAEVSFYKRPGFWDRNWSLDDSVEGTFFVDEGMSGVITPCAPGSANIPENDDVLQVTGGRFPFVSLACYNGLSVWPSYGCLYTKLGNPCRFCCIPGEYDENRMLIEQDGWLDAMSDSFAGAVRELGDDIENVSFAVDSGTLPGRDKGTWAYVKVLEAIKSKLPGGKLPKFIYVRAVMEPPYDVEDLTRLRDAGFTSIQCDIDIYDDDERLEIMPNAKGKRPIDDYVDILTKARDIFLDEIATQLVAGTQKDENLLKGVERFASVGIPTLVTPFLPFGQGLHLVREGKAAVPSPDKMRWVYENCANILTKHGLDAPEFRGGVSSIGEWMGRRLKRIPSLTHDFDKTPRESDLKIAV